MVNVCQASYAGKRSLELAGRREVLHDAFRFQANGFMAPLSLS